MSQRNLDRTNWMGVCLLVIGVAYLNNNFHWDFFNIHFYLPHYLFSWQVILIAIGFLLMLLGRRAGLFLMLLGAFFLITDEIFMVIGHIYQWWPVALILLGVIMLARSRTVQKS